MLTLALSSWSFHRRLPTFGPGHRSPDPEESELSILDFPRLGASLGLRDIEVCQAHLASTDRTYIEEVRAAVERSGCRIVNVPIDVGVLSEPDPGRRRDEIARIIAWIDVAHQLGSPSVRVNAGSVEHIDETAALKIVAEGYRTLADYCAQRGMVVLLENHGGLSTSPDAIIQLLEMVDAPGFRLCPDFGNFAPDVREEGLRRMLPYAAMVHAKTMDIDENGTHLAFDLGRCVDLVVESGYSGPLSIEFEGSGDEEQGVMRAREFLMSRLKQKEREA